MKRKPKFKCPHCKKPYVSYSRCFIHAGICPKRRHP